MKELILNFFSFGLAVSLERFLSFLLIPLYASVFSVTEFGVIDLVQTFIGVVTIFCFLQLETSLQRFYYEYEGEDKKKFLFSIFSLILSITFLLSLGVAVCADYLSNWLCENQQYAMAIRIAAMQMVFSVLSTLTLILLRFEKKNKFFTLVVLVKSLLLISFVYYFVSVMHYGINGFFLSQLIAIALSSLFSLFLVRKLFIFHLSKPYLKLSLKYALPQFPARVGSATNAYANRFFILGYLDTYHIGLFSMALKIGSIMQLIHQTFMMAWNQYMFETLKKKNHKQMFIILYRMTVPAVFFISLCLFLFSEELIVAFASPKFVESARYVGCIAIAIALLIVKELVDIGPKYLSKTYFLSISFLSALGVNLVSLFFLVRYLELSGVVFSMVLTNIVLLALSWLFSYRLYPIEFPYRTLLFSALPALIMAITMIYVSIPLHYRIVMLFLLAGYYSLLIYKGGVHYKKTICSI